jgi:transcription elongation GreA/GreB family factor
VAAAQGVGAAGAAVSRAFVREDAQGKEPLPARVISPHPNWVTREGLAQLGARVRDLERTLADLRGGGDDEAIAAVERDLYYYRARRATARLVLVEPEPQVVRFGVRVLLRLADGSRLRLRLVGEDEADPSAGRVSYV